MELELQGKAENSADGSITINAEGPEEVLAQLVEWCHQGPMGAKISKVETAEPAEPFAAKMLKVKTCPSRIICLNEKIFLVTILILLLAAGRFWWLKQAGFADGAANKRQTKICN